MLLDCSVPHATNSSSRNPEGYRATIVLLRLTGLAHRSRKREGRLLRLGGKLTNAGVDHNEEVTSTASLPPPDPATVVVWLQRKELEGKTPAAPIYLASYPLTEESVDLKRKATLLSCVWPYETSLIGFDFLSGQEEKVTIGLGLKRPGVDRIEHLGVAPVYLPVNEENEWNLIVSVDPMKNKSNLFGKLGKRKDCEYTILPSTVFHMKLQVTKKESALGIHDALVEKESFGHACDEDTTYDATNTTPEESNPNLLGMSSSVDGSKSATISEKEEHFTEKELGINDKKTAELNSLTNKHPPISSANEHVTKLALQRKLQIKRVVQEPVPEAIQYYSNNAKEKKLMLTRSKATGTPKTSMTATAENLNRVADFGSSDSHDSLDNFFMDPFGQTVQINDVVLFPAFDTASSLQPSTVPQAKSGVSQIHDQDVKQLDQQQSQTQMCNVGQNKTVLADLVFADDKPHSWDFPGDDAGHSLQQSCEVPSMEIDVPQEMAGVRCENNVESTDDRHVKGTDRQSNPVQKQDIEKTSLADVVFNCINNQSSDVSACSVVTEIRSGVEQSRLKPMKIIKGVLNKKKEKKEKRDTTKKKSEVKDGSKKVKNNNHRKKLSPKIIGQQMTSSALPSLISIAKEEEEPVAHLIKKKGKLEKKVMTANDDIEQESLTQVTRSTIDEDSLTLASTVTMDGTEVSIRSSDYGNTKSWTTVFEDTGFMCSDVLLCCIIEEETQSDCDFEKLNSDGSILYSEDDSFSGEYFRLFRQESQDSFVCLHTEYDVVLQQMSHM
ncbi:hypothetical protein ACHAXA_002323 [Cyclostephanos tholiformis]|uniref:Uncharacterized protein n=1 Tax=Cyclostephanos tholiformis TaxID=382380 RepID=A0ABD3SS44_9STRA